jgi:DNA-binding response OmpR family regulator
VLTNREFELLQFLLDHPHRHCTSSQIFGYAWLDSALFL